MITPGQLGPIRVMSKPSTIFFTSNISKVGTPSVIQTINFIPASAASRIAPLQKGAGTNINDAFGCTCSTASLTELKTGKSKCEAPPFPGVTPPTILVPYSID